MANANKKCYLFVGNPGTGKSTILNGLIGEPKFTAKTSTTGTGVTYQFDKQEIPGKGVYMDTPGLSDEKLRKNAAAAITTALKQDGYYRIFFVVTTEAGRVRPDDKTTMKLILDASPEITNYSIIVNKATSKWVEQIKQPEVLAPWITVLMSGLPKVTSSIHFMSRDEDLEDMDNVKYNAPKDVIDFVENAPGMKINSASVKAVSTSEFDKMRELNANLQRELERSKEKMKAETARVEQAMKAQMKTMEESAKRMRIEVDSAKEAARHAEQRARSGSGRRSILGEIGEVVGQLFGL